MVGRPPHIPDEWWVAQIEESLRGWGTAAERHEKAKELAAWATTEGIRIRRDVRIDRIGKLRGRVKALGAAGRYPRHLWDRLRTLEAEQLADLAGEYERA